MRTVIMMLGLTYLAEIWKELTFTALLGQLWALPLLIALVALNLATINKWVLYALLVILLMYPNGKSIPAVHPVSIVVPVSGSLLISIIKSPPHPSRLELEECQRSAHSDRVCGML